MVAFRPQRSWSASDKAKVRRAALIESSIRRTRVSPAGPFRGIAQNDQMRSRRASHPWAVQRSVVRSRQKVRGLAGKVSKFSSVSTMGLIGSCGGAACERDVELHVRAQVLHQHPRLDENSAGSPRHAGTMQHDEFADE